MAILFIDVDGTLVNSYPGIAACIRATMDELGLPQPSDAQLHRLPGPPLRDTLAAWGYASDAVERIYAAFHQVYDTSGWKRTTLHEGWADALPRWKAAGHTLCTATSKGDTVTTRILDQLGVLEHFDFIGGADDEGGTRKRKREVIEWVLDSMGLRGHESEILMIGDRSHDTAGARPLGIATALVGWGHGSQPEFDDADFFAPDFPALEAIVAEWTS